jgi:hypothetical protein
MKQHIAITDLTRMQGPKVCIAGYTKDGRCLRPVIPFQGIQEWFLRKDDCLIIRPFAVVELDFLRPVPQAPHTEDWEIDHFHRRLVVAQLPEEKKRRLMDRTASPSVAAIFGAHIRDDFGFYIQTGEGERSLGTVRPAEVSQVVYEPKAGGKWDYRLVFKDQAGETYRLAVTDLAYRCCLDYGRLQVGYPVDEMIARLARLLNGRDSFLRIGLARQWERFPDRCYLQVTGVHTFPDYLRGRSYADFVTRGSALHQESSAKARLA